MSVSSTTKRHTLLSAFTSNVYQLATRFAPMFAPTPGNAAPKPVSHSSPARSVTPHTGTLLSRVPPPSASSDPASAATHPRLKVFHSPTELLATMLPSSTANLSREASTVAAMSATMASSAPSTVTRPAPLSEATAARLSPTTAKCIAPLVVLTSPSCA